MSPRIKDPKNLAELLEEQDRLQKEQASHREQEENEAQIKRATELLEEQVAIMGGLREIKSRSYWQDNEKLAALVAQYEGRLPELETELGAIPQNWVGVARNHIALAAFGRWEYQDQPDWRDPTKTRKVPVITELFVTDKAAYSRALKAFLETTRHTPVTAEVVSQWQNDPNRGIGKLLQRIVIDPTVNSSIAYTARDGAQKTLWGASYMLDRYDDSPALRRAVKIIQLVLGKLREENRERKEKLDSLLGTSTLESWKDAVVGRKPGIKAGLAVMRRPLRDGMLPGRNEQLVTEGDRRFAQFTATLAISVDQDGILTVIDADPKATRYLTVRDPDTGSQDCLVGKSFPKGQVPRRIWNRLVHLGDPEREARVHSFGEPIDNSLAAAFAAARVTVTVPEDESSQPIEEAAPKRRSTTKRAPARATKSSGRRKPRFDDEDDA